MALTNPLFASNLRLQNAAQNAPAMRRGEQDHVAVAILQNALIGVNAGTFRRSLLSDGSLDGDYGGETAAAVARFQEMTGLASGGRKGDGIAGRNTLEKLDEAAPRTAVANGISTNNGVVVRAENSRTLGPVAGTLPNASDLRHEYGKFREVNGKPCNQSISNQCAVRMSVALMRCDIGFHFDRTKIEYTHSDCGAGAEHNASASRLFNYLKTIWTFQKYSKVGTTAQTAGQIMMAVSGRSGIIYFEDCFERSNGTAGDHIDYWNGSCVMNDLLNYNGPGEREPEDNLRSNRWFRKAARNIWFLGL